jgi:3-methylcrotonyl-CoA carboxylase alpha subunit/acetyl-CoA/propionyl-CoA carboxylase biotin carboxyl carrier protein
MPGTVLSVSVTPGQRVEAGDVLGILEAMKMELTLTAPVDGAVTGLEVAAGDQVALGATLFVVTPGTPAAEPSGAEAVPADGRSGTSVGGGPR